MHVRFQGKRAHPPNQIPKAQVLREIRAEDQGVHEQPDHVFKFDFVARPNRGPDQNALLIGVAPE